VIFCGIGFLASVGLLVGLWRRYFVEVSIWVVAACILALGLAIGVPSLFSQADVYEVPISCAYMLTMLALGAVWCALHKPARRWQWLATASVAYGLAMGARPNLLFGAVILLVPVVQALRARQRIWSLLAAAIGPLALIGLWLMLYNFLRFDNPLEFGLQYQLGPVSKVGRGLFHLRYLWFNFRVYFLEPARWSAHFPFVHEILAPPPPAGYALIQGPFGVLTNIPLVWLALAAPLAWQNRPHTEPAASALPWFMAAVALLFGACVLPLLFYDNAIFRFEVDFLPSFVLLAAVGILGLERATFDDPVRRRAARWVWGSLVAVSVLFNLLASVQGYASEQLAIGDALERVGQRAEAIEHYEKALRIRPEYAKAHYNLGLALWRNNQLPEAIEHYKEAVRITPDFTEAHVNLAIALSQIGSNQEALTHFTEALRLRPDSAEVHCNLGFFLLQAGKLPEAVEHFEQALRIKPDYVEAHFNLGLALERLGRTPEAIEHYQQALRIRPDFNPAKNALARLQAGH
jgi:tetratricopeptide (TPR) repeat protein